MTKMWWGGHEEHLTVERTEYTQAALIPINCTCTSCCEAHYIIETMNTEIKENLPVYYINVAHSGNQPLAWQISNKK
jgi:hypothetical protein